MCVCVCVCVCALQLRFQGYSDFYLVQTIIRQKNGLSTNLEELNVNIPSQTTYAISIIDHCLCNIYIYILVQIKKIINGARNFGND